MGLYIYYLNAKMIRREEIEMRSAQHVLYPVLFAERDREYLKQLRRNRDEEAKLMANVPGWEVGFRSHNRECVYANVNCLFFVLVGWYLVW